MGETSDLEWDDDKDAANRRKHGFPLRFADLILSDPLHLDTAVKVDEAGEQRRIMIGKAGPTMLFCVYVWRGKRRRLISLRTASRKERRAYQTQVDASRNRR